MTIDTSGSRPQIDTWQLSNVMRRKTCCSFIIQLRINIRARDDVTRRVQKGKTPRRRRRRRRRQTHRRSKLRTSERHFEVAVYSGTGVGNVDGKGNDEYAISRLVISKFARKYARIHYVRVSAKSADIREDVR